ncbi:MAG TPA: arsenite methyltransferase [Anaerolineales bacterium]|nr:arsenite methyltransferase [Anaerolineales bacterium]
MDDIDQAHEIRSHVRQHYHSLAAESPANVSCCGPDCGCGTGDPFVDSVIYSPEELESLPEAVRNLSLGCGNPVALASLEPGQVVADLGSGGGIDCFLAAQRVGPEGHIIGVDMTPGMIDAARRNQRAIGLTNVEFRLGEIEHLPLADSSVDVVISNCVLNLSPDKLEALKEAHRVLRPGGRLAVSDILATEPLTAELAADMGAWASCVSGAIETQAFRDLLGQAGFVDVEIDPVEDSAARSAEAGRTAPVFQATISGRKAI